MSKDTTTLKDIRDGWTCAHVQRDMSPDEAGEVFDRVINRERAEMFNEGAEHAWRASGEGCNGEYAPGYGTHDGRVGFFAIHGSQENPYEDPPSQLPTDIGSAIWIMELTTEGLSRHAGSLPRLVVRGPNGRWIRQPLDEGIEDSMITEWANVETGD